MGRPRNPQRDLSLKRYLEMGGEISTAKLAQLAGVPESRIRKWKSEDRWEEALKKKPKKRGGQKAIKMRQEKPRQKMGTKTQSRMEHLQKQGLKIYHQKKQRKSET